MFRNAYTFTLLLLLGSQVVRAQKLMFENLGVRQGLPATEVYHLYQDRQGYVWANTEFGVVKHNGQAFIPVCTNLPLRESIMYAMTQSPDGELYLANSRAEIYRLYHDSAFRVVGLEKSAAEIRSKGFFIEHFYFDEAQNLHFSTDEKTYTFSPGTYRIPGLPAAAKSRQKRHMHVAADLQYNVVNPNGSGQLNVVNQYGRRVYSFARPVAHTYRYSIRNFGKELFIALGFELMVRKSNGTIRNVRFEKPIIGFERLPNGHFLVGLTYGGMYELDADLSVLHHYFGDVSVGDVLCDDQSGIWVSTIGEGIYYCRNSNNRSYSNIPELAGSISMLKVIGNRLFIGTSVGNLFVKEGRNIRKIDLPTAAYINDIAEFQGWYYIATKMGTLAMDAHFRHIEPDAQLIQRDKKVLASYAFLAERKSHLFVVSSSVLFKIDGNWKRREWVVSHKMLLRCIALRNDGEVFVGTREGLYRVKDAFSCPDFLKPLRQQNISMLKTDCRGQIWIGTKGAGLYRLTSGNRLIHYPSVPSAIIYDLCFVHDSILVVSTNRGAFVNSLRRINEKSAWILLQQEEIIRLELYRDQLFMATKSGLTTLSVGKLFRPNDCRFYLKAIVAGGTKIPLQRNIQLSHRQNHLDLTFDLLAYRFPDKRLYYRLDGPSPLAGAVTGTQLHLQNLSPGTYTLYAYPEMHLVNSRRQVVRLVFHIDAAFWQTKLFLVLVILLSVLSTSTVTWFVIRGMRDRQERKISIEKLLAEYQLTALKAQINPHFMSNSLVAIQQLILTGQTDSANRYIAKFSLLIRYLLNYSDRAVISLRHELEIIDLYVELEQLRFNNRFVFNCEIDPDLKVMETFIPALITQPLIENAIWHGLLPLAGQRVPQLTLKIAWEETVLVISVMDNGVGRSEPLAVAKEPDDIHESKGTLLIRTRIEHLNRLYGVSGGRMQFTDVIDEQGNPAGSTVQLFFPLDLLNQLYDERNQNRHH